MHDYDYYLLTWSPTENPTLRRQWIKERKECVRQFIMRKSSLFEHQLLKTDVICGWGGLPDRFLWSQSVYSAFIYMYIYCWGLSITKLYSRNPKYYIFSLLGKRWSNHLIHISHPSRAIASRMPQESLPSSARAWWYTEIPGRLFGSDFLRNWEPI